MDMHTHVGITQGWNSANTFDISTMHLCIYVYVGKYNIAESSVRGVVEIWMTMDAVEQWGDFDRNFDVWMLYFERWNEIDVRHDHRRFNVAVKN